jgi:hypothetical protein
MTRVLSAKSAMRKALVLSVGVHAALFGLARPLALHPASAAPAPVELPDRWAGTTAELPGSGATAAVYDVSLEAAASPAPLPAAAPVPVPAPAPAPDAPRARATTTASATATETPPAPPKRRARPAPVAEGVARAASSGGAADHGHGGGGGTFGAEGAGGVRDLGRAFTRAIPPANDSDPVWAQAPLGDTGKLEVEVRVDDAGHITSAEPRGVDRPKALVSLVRRTVPLLQAGIFALRNGSVSEGSEILELRAVVTESADAMDNDRLRFSYDHGRGKAGFTQATGRHVEVTVKVLRVEAR